MRALMQQGRLAEAVQQGERLLATVKRQFGADHLNVAIVLTDLGLVHTAMRRFDLAAKAHHEAAVIRRARLGERHLDLAQSLHNLGDALLALADYGRAEAAYRQSLGIREALSGPEDIDVGAELNAIGMVYRDQARYGEARAHFERALKIFEGKPGRALEFSAAVLNNLAILADIEGRYGDAEAIYQRVIAIDARTKGPNDLDVARTLNNLALTYSHQGRYVEAVSAFERTLAIREKVQGLASPGAAGVLVNMGHTLKAEGRYAQAAANYRRALATFEQVLGDHPRTAGAATSLANSYLLLLDQSRNAEAEALYKRAITIIERKLRPGHPEIVNPLIGLADLHYRTRRYSDALATLSRALGILEPMLGPGHPKVADLLHNIAVSQSAAGQRAAAEASFKRAIAAYETVLGPEHRDVAKALTSFADHLAKTGKLDEAMVHYRRAAAILASRENIAQAALRPAEQARRFGTFAGLIETAYRLADTDKSRTAGLAGEALVAMQREQQSSAGAALRRMAARFSQGSGPLANLLRERQDLAGRLQAMSTALIDALSRPESERDAAVEGRIRAERARLEARLAAVDAAVQRQHPDFATLATPVPSGLEEVRSLLQPDEALVAYLVREDATFVWAVTRDGLAWRRLELGAQALTEMIASIRRSVEGDPSATTGASELKALHALYTQVLGAIEDLIAGKHHLLVVPSGALTALPFHMLVSAEPRDADYRAAQWLVRRHAITTLPSVDSLKALRAIAKAGNAAKRLIGFADPVFGSSNTSAPGAAARARAARQVAGFSGYFSDVGVDRDHLARALPPLPGTAAELKAVASRLGVPAADVRLGASASEAAVKQARLDQYAIVYFATHGLVAGETSQVSRHAEPALAFTIPEHPTAIDDGLLLASEVAQLKLNADWVVLSACNTAAGSRPGAEPLSGLARAFFYAGARALLVSHWPVDDQAGAQLVVDLFENLQRDASLRRSEALRRAMLNMIDNSTDQLLARPTFWAPFMVVGEDRAG